VHADGARRVRIGAQRGAQQPERGDEDRRSRDPRRQFNLAAMWIVCLIWMIALLAAIRRSAFPTHTD
jgi:hypothetical protein